MIAFFEEANRVDRWPRYRRLIEGLVKKGTPPDFWDPERPWAAVISMAASDRNHWYDSVEAPIRDGNSRREIAEAASRVHRSFLPRCASDGFNQMMDIGIEAEQGPYARRAASGGKGGAQARLVREYAPPAPAEEVVSEPQNQFCYRFNRGSGCTGIDGECHIGRLHLCEFCQGNHMGANCRRTFRQDTKADSKTGKEGKTGKKRAGKKGPGRGKAGVW